ncbi:SH3 domain protein, partial [Trypanosoma cruzi]
VISQLAKHVDPFDLPESTVRIWEVHHTADPGVVAGRIGVKGEAAARQEPWLRAEERFFHDFHHNHAATITGRAPRTRPATPQDERTIPLQQVNVPVLNLEWIQCRLHPATLESLMQVWDSSGGPLFLNPPPVKRAKSSGGFRSLTRYG